MQVAFKWKRFDRPALDTLPKTFRLTEEHRNIIEATDRYKLLSSAHIIKLFCQTPTEVKRCRDHLRELNRRRYIYRPSAQRTYYAEVNGSKPLVYGLDFRGAALLGERPGFARARHAQAQRSRTLTSRLFIDHALEIADFMVQLELSAAASGVHLIHAYTLLESAPKRRSKHSRISPWMWETRIRRGREERSVWIEPDQMFGLSFSDTRPEQFYFLECDRGTMPVERKDLSKTSFLRKFLSYADTRKRGLHTKTYNLSNFTVLTVAPTARRMQNLITSHQRHTKGAVHPNLFLFTDRPTLLRSRDVFTLPWLNGNGKRVRLVP